MELGPYELPGFYTGDCRELMAALPAGSVQCVVTSPPYWGLREYSGEQRVVWADGIQSAYSHEPTPEQYVAHTIEIMRAIRRVLKADGLLFWNIGDARFRGPGGEDPGKNASCGHTKRRIQGRAPVPPGRMRGDLALLPFRVAVAAQDDGWFTVMDIIWHKINGMPEALEKRPTKSHEYILILAKSPKYYWDKEAVMEEVTGNAHARGHGVNPKAATASGGIRQNASYSGSINGLVEKRNMRSVWPISTKPYRGPHYAVFPPDIPHRCIRAATRLEDVVLDPFFGSGTTGRVAEDLGRRNWLGFDISEEYSELQKERTGQMSMIAKLMGGEHQGKTT